MSVSIKGSRTIVGSEVSAKTIVLRRCFTPNNVNTVEDRDKPAKRGETGGLSWTSPLPPLRTKNNMMMNTNGDMQVHFLPLQRHAQLPPPPPTEQIVPAIRPAPLPLNPHKGEQTTSRPRYSSPSPPLRHAPGIHAQGPPLLLLALVAHGRPLENALPIGVQLQFCDGYVGGTDSHRDAGAVDFLFCHSLDVDDPFLAVDVCHAALAAFVAAAGDEDFVVLADGD